MTKKEFENCKINDKVKCLETFPDLPFKNCIGTIIDKNLNLHLLGIQWEESFPLGHSCSNKGEHGFCRNYDFGSRSQDENLIILELLTNKQLELEF